MIPRPRRCPQCKRLFGIALVPTDHPCNNTLDVKCGRCNATVVLPADPSIPPYIKAIPTYLTYTKAT